MVRGERWLVTGATGQVGAALSAAASEAGVEVVRASLSGRSGSIACDLRDPRAAGRLLEASDPDRVVHLAAVSRPALAQERTDLAHELNVMATALIAAWCSRRRRGLIFASTDQVFSGSRGPYREADAPAPTTTYGRTKAAAERFATAAGGLVVRLGWVLNDRPAAPRLDFIEHGLTRLQQGAIVDAAHDEHRTPVYSSELSAAILRLAEIGQAGAVHVAGNVHVTPYELLRTRAVGAGLDPTRVRPISRLKLAPAGRPRDVRLDTTLMQSLFAHSNRSLHA